MKKTAFAIALLLSGAAFAQTSDTLAVDPMAEDNVAAEAVTNDVLADTSLGGGVATHAYHGDGTASAAFETEAGTSLTSAMPVAQGTLIETAAASGAVVQPGNDDPERDARGIAVISAAAMVPAGWNGVAASDAAMGGPLLDPATGEAIGSEQNYPACTATITDNCLQTYERQGR